MFDDEFQLKFIRSIFATGEESDEDSDHAVISEHVWTCQNISIVYHLALLAPGHGNSLWNSSECIAQYLLLPSYRTELFGQKVERKITWPPLRALEFGAGAALPSMALLKEGAEKVICTDKYVNEQTFDALRMSVDKNSIIWGMTKEQVWKRTVIMPQTWGKEVEKLTREGGRECKIDMLIASDCIYDPTYHEALLQSVVGSIARDKGIFIVGYSFHMNVPPEKVISFFDLANSHA